MKHLQASSVDKLILKYKTTKAFHETFNSEFDRQKIMHHN